MLFNKFQKLIKSNIEFNQMMQDVTIFRTENGVLSFYYTLVQAERFSSFAFLCRS